MVNPQESAGIDFDRLIDRIKDERAVAEFKLRDIEGTTNANNG